MSKKCCVQNCVFPKGREISFFAFPKDVNSREVWKNILKIRSDVSKKYVCSRNFSNSDIQGKS